MSCAELRRSKTMRRFFLLALTLLAPTGILSGTAHALDNCIVPNGATYTINEHSVCRRVQNNRANGLPIMVPTKISTEWSVGASSFLNATPTGVAITACGSCGDTGNCAASSGGGVTPGSQSFTTAGSFNFVVPCHNNLTVQVWGGGAGGQSVGFGSVAAASSSSWNTSVLIAGGGGPPSSSTYLGGTGGTATGGTTNSAGENGGNGGNNLPSGKGGDSPNGGLGGASQASLSSGGISGTEPGGGGSGGRGTGRGSQGGPGGGGGGYTARTWTQGTYSPGTSIPIIVGPGSAGSTTGGNRGGNGATGRVTISWN